MRDGLVHAGDERAELAREGGAVERERRRQARRARRPRARPAATGRRSSGRSRPPRKSGGQQRAGRLAARPGPRSRRPARRGGRPARRPPSLPGTRLRRARRAAGSARGRRRSQPRAIVVGGFRRRLGRVQRPGEKRERERTGSTKDAAAAIPLSIGEDEDEGEGPKALPRSRSNANGTPGRARGPGGAAAPRTPAGARRRTSATNSKTRAAFAVLRIWPNWAVSVMSRTGRPLFGWLSTLKASTRNERYGCRRVEVLVEARVDVLVARARRR